MKQLLQPIAALVYCNHQVATTRPAAGEKLNAPVNSAHDDASTFDRQLGTVQVKLFYVIS